MKGAFALRDEIIANGETQTKLFMKIFQRLLDEWEKDVGDKATSE